MSKENIKAIIKSLPKIAWKERKENKAFFAALKKRTPKYFDETVHALHEEVFKKIDCLECGNCCRALGPRITEKDIAYASKYLRIKPSVFVEQYLRLDEDSDYVFKNMPCPFLQTDNYCSIYDARPKACDEYPHTDRRRFVQLLDITMKNLEVCPAVYEIVRKLKAQKHVDSKGL
jgi:Fe-S-cluster containining protein